MALTALAGWQNFYVILGSSAGALIGLQFVVLTIIASDSLRRSGAAAGSAFATPTIVHFGVVLALAGVIVAPWKEAGPFDLLCGSLGLLGLIYSMVVMRRVRRQTSYRPEFEDWLFHVVLPLVAYATLCGSAVAAGSHLEEALFAVGAAALALLFIGIHNAWDAVTYHVFHRP